jgi:hypothetical protein
MIYVWHFRWLLRTKQNYFSSKILGVMISRKSSYRFFPEVVIINMRNFIFCLKIQHIFFMTYTSVFIILELLEQILYFLAVDKSLYFALFVSQHWYRYGAPILWKRIKLKGKGLYLGQTLPNDYNYIKDHPRLNKYIRIECAKNLFQLKKFIKLVLVRRKQMPVYCSNITYLKILYYYSLSDKKIISIVHSCPNIIYLNFKNSIEFSKTWTILI